LVGVESCEKMNLRLSSEEIVFTKVKPTMQRFNTSNSAAYLRAEAEAEGGWDFEVWKE
jgi:hypothetical protein